MPLPEAPQRLGGREVYLQVGPSKKPHRFVVVRRPIAQNPIEAQQLTLFNDRKYVYHVLVTNLKINPWRVRQFYAPRATVEKNIRELLYDYPLGKIPSEDLVANVAFFRFCYLPSTWFIGSNGFAYPESIFMRPPPIEFHRFLVLPAKLTQKGSMKVLSLPHAYHYRELFEKAFQKIDQLRFS